MFWPVIKAADNAFTFDPSKMNSTKILIVEDDVFIAQDIQEYLANMQYAVSGIAYDAEDAMKELSGNPPNLVLLDIHLGEGKSGIDIAIMLRDVYQIPFIFLTSYANKATLEEAKQTRPLGYIVKPFDEKDLFTTIEIALYNHAQRWKNPTWHVEGINQKFRTDFTPKEVEILQDVFEGKTNRQLCEKHHVSLNTIKSHVKNIYEKLDVHSRSEAMAKIRKGIEE
ncbi:MAG: response regulator transcription factor [Bacteroidota bacterium]